MTRTSATTKPRSASPPGAAPGLEPRRGHERDRAAVDGSHEHVAGSGEVPAAVRDALDSPGQALDPDSRVLMESRFGHDFGRVRVHADARAAASARAVGAAAYTVGGRIVFGEGRYAPGTAEGRRLLAHELVHVVQQGGSAAHPTAQARLVMGALDDPLEAEADGMADRALATSWPAGGRFTPGTSPSLVVRRAPALKGRTTAEKIDDSIAPEVDKALAESPTITKYVKAKDLKPAAGHFAVEVPEVFASLYAKYAKAFKDPTPADKVGGFMDRKAGKITMKARSADVEGAVHEAVHLNSGATFQNYFGHPSNEGVTEYFTEKVLKEQKLASGQAYRDELKMAEGLVSAFDEGQVGRAYFQDEGTAYKTVREELGKKSAFGTWFKQSRSDDPADWVKATNLLKGALGK